MDLLEGNLWAIKEVEGRKIVGNIVVYVDDMLVAAEDTVMKGFMDRLQQEWKTSPPEMVSSAEWRSVKEKVGSGWANRRTFGTWWRDIQM